MKSPGGVRRAAVLLGAASLVLGGAAGVRSITRPAAAEPGWRAATPADVAPLRGPSEGPPSTAADAVPVPTVDLELIGVLGDGEARQAMFTRSAADRSATRVVLGEGEEDAWLQVRAVDFAAGAVTAVLKQPIVRSRNVGTDVLFTLQTRRTSSGQRDEAR